MTTSSDNSGIAVGFLIIAALVATVWTSLDLARDFKQAEQAKTAGQDGADSAGNSTAASHTRQISAIRDANTGTVYAMDVTTAAVETAIDLAKKGDEIVIPTGPRTAEQIFADMKRTLKEQERIIAELRADNQRLRGGE